MGGHSGKDLNLAEMSKPSERVLLCLERRLREHCQKQWPGKVRSLSVKARGTYFYISADLAGDDEGDGDEEDSEALEEVMKAMPPEVLARVLKLKGLDNERSELFTAYEAERCALEAKYRALYAPLYATRADVVNGRLDVPLPEELMDHAKVDGEKVRKLNK